MIRLELGKMEDHIKSIEDNSIDSIITDPPFGTTAAKWDEVVDFDLMWKEFWRVLKPKGMVVSFAAQPFTTDLIYSQRKHYKYSWQWVKEQGTGQLNCKRRPMMQTEDIAVFYKKFGTYNPQMREGKAYKRKPVVLKGSLYNGGNDMEVPALDRSDRYPLNLLHYNRPIKDRVHPTQKPLGLMEYLARTYNSPGETILDPFMGSGTTGVAAVRNGYNFIGIEMEQGLSLIHI